MKTRPESINGRLLQFFGEWKVQTGYGTFKLSKDLQSKPDACSSGSWVSGIVALGEVVSYHFEDEAVG